MKGFLCTFVVILVLALITVAVYLHAEAPVGPNLNATSTPATSTQVMSGEVSMKLYETRVVQDTTINVRAVTEDSRCPANANCIWAGKVVVALNVGTAMGTTTTELELGESMTTETKKIALKEVLPQPIAGKKSADGEYVFVFSIENHTPAIVTPVQPAPSKECYVGGCSSQICSDRPGMVSTCEWTESYVCYKGATCERQASGQCGWTQTPELMKCLSNEQ